MKTIKVGDKFGNLTISSEPISIRTNTAQVAYKFKAICVCGSEREYWRSNLMNGKSKSCGCMSPYALGKRGVTSKTRLKEVPYRAALYQKWTGPKGAKNEFPNYIDWEKHCINNGYKPRLPVVREVQLDGSVVWKVTPREQVTGGKMITWQGESKSARRWAQDPRVKWSYQHLYNRLKKDPDINPDELLGS